MSVYGLDLIIDKEGKPHLNEINGVRSGMRGFEQVYGDNRVEEKVHHMLKGKYGKITVNNGTYARNKFRKEHPFQTAIAYSLVPLFFLLSKTPFVRRIFDVKPAVLSSGKAQTDWLNEKSKKVFLCKFPFDTYKGQKSTVINMRNEQLPHPTVNDYVVEEITNNKLFQYLVLKDSKLKKLLPKSTLIGLGSTDDKELEKILKKSEKFVIKPILGQCGLGVKVIDKKEAGRFQNQGNEVNDVHAMSLVLDLAQTNKDPAKWEGNVEYFEDYVDKKDFSFEMGISLIQPFIDSRNGSKTYSAVRAIVCNGEFVDAYQRVSKNPRVNISQGAKARPFERKGFDKLCKKIVAVFENKCSKYKPKTFKYELYKKYIEEKGRIPKNERGDNTMPQVGKKFVDLISMYASKK